MDLPYPRASSVCTIARLCCAHRAPDQEDRDPRTPHDAGGVSPRSKEDAYTAHQAARVLGLSDRWVRQMIEAGELEGERDALGKWWILQRAVHTALEDHVSPRSTRSREHPTEA